MTTLYQIAQNTLQKEVAINNNISAVAPAGFCANKSTSTSGLNFYYYGGYYPKGDNTFNTLADGSIALTASTTNYVEYDPWTNTVSKVTGSFTANRIPLYTIATNTTTITAINDYRVSINRVRSEGYENVVTPTASTTNSYAHGITATTKKSTQSNIQWQVVLKCNTAEYGYSVGDEVVPLGSTFTGFCNSTNIGYVVGAAVQLLDRTGGNIGNVVSITLSNWRVVLRATSII